MTDLTATIHSFIDDEHAPTLLAKYYSGRYTGSLFDHAIDLQSPDPDRFTAHDIAAVATLSVPLEGRAVQDLLAAELRLSALLKKIPHDADLAVADDTTIARLYELQAIFDKDVHGVGPVTRSKLLAHKRPSLVPIRDQYVLKALIGRPDGAFTEPLRDALRTDPSIARRVAEIQAEARTVPVSTLRALDVVVWMAAHGNEQVGK